MADFAEYPATSRTVPTRHRERATFDVEAIHAVLDEALSCHVGIVVDGEPVVLPTIHARVGRRLYLHASTGARLARLAADAETDGGVPVCVTVTLLDGLVLARSQFHHSMNYRSVVVRGRAGLVTDARERETALAAIVDHVVPGRSTASRPANARELAATAVLRVDLKEATLKQRSGGPRDDAEDLSLGYWAGVIPVTKPSGSPFRRRNCHLGRRLRRTSRPGSRHVSDRSSRLDAGELLGCHVRTGRRAGDRAGGTRLVHLFLP